MSTDEFLTGAHCTCWPRLMFRRTIHRTYKPRRNPNGVFSILQKHTYASTSLYEDWIRSLLCSSQHILPPYHWMSRATLLPVPLTSQCLITQLKNKKFKRILEKMSQRVLYLFCFVNIVFESLMNLFYYGLSLGIVRDFCFMKNVITVTE